MSTVHIYTDGACRGNPGPGGWGALLVYGTHRRELFGGEPHTTNNRMELTAAIHALEALKRPATVVLTTDSQYLRKGITEWIDNWVRSGWRTASRRPVKNQDLWQRLHDLTQTHTVDWRWAPGHDRHPGNETADALANRGIDHDKG